MPVILFPTEPSAGEGSTELAVEGTGDAIPRGIEAVFSYNGLTINQTSFIDKYRITSIDGLGDADIRDARQENPAEHGETTFDSYYGGRSLTFNGRIEAYTLNKMRDMQVALRSAFIDLQERPLYWLTGDVNKDHYINCKKNASLEMGETQQHQNHFFREFQINLRASNPRIFRNQAKTYTIFPNQLSNSSFEVNTTGWSILSTTGWTSPTLQRQNTWSTNGLWSLRATATKDDTVTLRNLDVISSTGLNGAPVLPSVQYTAFADVNILDSATNGAAIRITWYNSGGTSISTSAENLITGSGEFTLSTTATSPANAAYAAVRIRNQTATNLDIVDLYIDNAWLVQGAPTVPGVESVSNTGNIEAEPTFKIHGYASGTLHITNDTSGEVLKFKDGVVINDGDFYLADHANKTLTNSAGDNIFGQLEDTSDWPEVGRGTQSLSLSPSFVGKANSKVEITFRDSYI